MIDQIWEYIKLIPLFVCKYANIALQWLQQNFGETVVDFFDSIGIIGCAVIMVLAILCWVILFKKLADDVDTDDFPHARNAAFGFIGLFFYGFVLIWIVGMLTHPLHEAGSWLLNSVFKEKALVSFADKTTTMLPVLPEGSTVTLDNFLYWHDFLAIGAVFVMAKFALTTVSSIFHLRFIKLICFWIITLSFVIVGMLCGGILTWLGDIDGTLLQLLSLPVFAAFYFVPALVVWFPVAAVYGGPVLYVLGLILSPVAGLLGWDLDSMPVETTEHTTSFSLWNGYWADHYITRDHTGLVTSVSSYFTFFF